jgi:hypothetical protein
MRYAFNFQAAPVAADALELDLIDGDGSTISTVRLTVDAVHDLTAALTSALHGMAETAAEAAAEAAVEDREPGSVSEVEYQAIRRAALREQLIALRAGSEIAEAAAHRARQSR